MSLDPLRTATFNALSPRLFYGWVILFVTGLAIFSSGPGQSHTFSVFVGPISEDLGLSKWAISMAYGLATFVAAFALPQMGKLVDRFGPRHMTIWVVVLLGVGCLLFASVIGPISLALAFALLRFLGQGSLMLNCANLLAQWFSLKRGFAMSLMALGFAASMAIHPPLGQYLIGEIGWRWAWVALGVINWLVMLPPVLLLIHDKPEPLGLLPDGAPAPAAGETTAPIDGLTLAESRREPAFYILCLGWFFISMLITCLHFYQITIFGAQGLDAAMAAKVFPVSAVAMVLFMPMVGKLLDRVKTRYVFGASMFVLSTSLVGITLVSDWTSAVIYAVVFGLSNAFSMSMFGYLMPRYFGRAHIGSVQGGMQMIAVVGASIGPLPVGLAFDLLGEHELTLRLLALLPMACAVLAIVMLRTPKGVSFPAHLE